jgi:hypothetical protein
MSALVDPRTDVRIALGVRFEGYRWRPTTVTGRLIMDYAQEGAPAPSRRWFTVKDVESVMRALRHWTQAAWLVEDAGDILPADWEKYVTSRSSDLRALPYPVVQGLAVGSLVVIVELTALLAAGGVRLIGRVLYLVEHYWHIRLRLQFEEQELRREIDRNDGEQSDRLKNAVEACERIDDSILVSLDDEEQLLAQSGVVAASAEELADDESLMA